MSGPAPVNPQNAIGGGNQIAQQQLGYNLGDIAPAQQAYYTGAQAGSLPNAKDWRGATQYAQSGTGPNGVPIYTETTSLSPIEQQIFGLQTGAQTKGGQAANQLLAGANYGAQDPSTVIGNATSGRVAQNLGTEVSALQPYFDLQTKQAQDTLAAQGITAAENPEAFNAGMLPVQTAKNSAVSAFLAGQEPVIWGQQEQAYTLPEQLASALTPQAQGPTPGVMPTLAGTQVQPVNVAGGVSAISPLYASQAQQQQAQYNAIIQALGGLGGAGITAFG